MCYINLHLRYFELLDFVLNLTVLKDPLVTEVVCSWSYDTHTYTAAHLISLILSFANTTFNFYAPHAHCKKYIM